MTHLENSMGAVMLGPILLIAAAVLVGGRFAQASIPKAQVTPARILHSTGVAMGGTSGGALSLMDFRRSISKKNKMERFILDFGGADLKEAKGLVGYYHMELEENPARMVLELPQTFASRLPEKEILKRLENSLYVKKAQIGFDRNLQSMTLIFQLKRPVQARIARIDNPNSSGKIVIDLLPENPLAKRRSEVRQRQASVKRSRNDQVQQRTRRPSGAAAQKQARFFDRQPRKTEAVKAKSNRQSTSRAPTLRKGMSELDRKAAASVQSSGTNR